MTEQTPAPETSKQAETPWWEDEALPWAHKPTRADFWAWGLLSFYALYGLAMYPLRPWLLTMPFVSAWLNGGRTAMVMVGALTAVRPDPHLWWLWTWLFATLTIVKWDLLMWWCGKLWGRNILDMWAGKKPRTKKWTDTLERLTAKHPSLAILITYLPIPFTPIVYAAAGVAGVSFKKFLALELWWAFIFQGLYLGLGYWIGAPAVKLLEIYSRYAMYVSLALLAVVIYLTVRNQNRRQDPVGPAATQIAE